MSYAERIAAGPRIAIQMMKRAVYHGLQNDLLSSLDLVSSHAAILASTADSMEAVKALNEKRPPQFNSK
jgi:enoyl-CoA hydratase/carnithine racemase